MDIFLMLSLGAFKVVLISYLFGHLSCHLFDKENKKYISKTTKNLSLLDTFHHFSAVQQVHKITQVESTRKWTSGITDNIIISSNYKLNTKRIFSISYLSYLLCRHSRVAAARRAPLHYCPSCHRRHAASCRATAALLHIVSRSCCRPCRRRDRGTA